MGLRSRLPVVAAFAAALLMLLGAVAARTAYADPKKDIQQKIKEAMENYDLLEYEEARKDLNQALTIAKQKHLENDPVTAQVHLRLGIVYKAGLNDDESAKLSFLSAAQIDPKITIDAAYKTPELQKMLDEAKKEAASGGGGGGGSTDTGGGGGDTGGGSIDMGADSGETVDCKTVSGLQHTIIDTAKGGAALRIDAFVGKDVNPARVSVMYRSKGATDFTEAKMMKSGDCKYSGQIPGAAMAGDLVHYYVAAFNKAGKAIASKGSSGSPNIIEVSGGGGGGGGGGGANPGDDEDPLHGGGHKAGPTHTATSDDTAASSSSSSDTGVSGSVTVGGKPASVFISLAGGTGAGFVTGETEQANNKVECCFAPDLAHVSVELGYYVTPTTAIGVAGRMGFPVGANIMDHATAAPAGLLRIHHNFAADGNGITVIGEIGGGVIRNTIKLTDAPSDMNVDIAAMGPLIVGAGAGYLAPLGGKVKLDAEINALAGIPVVTQIGLSHLNFGVEFDLSLGLLIGF